VEERKEDKEIKRIVVTETGQEFRVIDGAINSRKLFTVYRVFICDAPHALLLQLYAKKVGEISERTMSYTFLV
jgi:hypothetical protein